MENKTIKILPTAADRGKRIDIFISENVKELTRSNIKKLINQKNVSVNDVLIESQSRKVKEKDKIQIFLIMSQEN